MIATLVVRRDLRKEPHICRAGGDVVNGERLGGQNLLPNIDFLRCMRRERISAEITDQQKARDATAWLASFMQCIALADQAKAQGRFLAKAICAENYPPTRILPLASPRMLRYSTGFPTKGANDFGAEGRCR